MIRVAGASEINGIERVWLEGDYKCDYGIYMDSGSGSAHSSGWVNEAHIFEMQEAGVYAQKGNSRGGSVFFNRLTMDNNDIAIKLYQIGHCAIWNSKFEKDQEPLLHCEDVGSVILHAFVNSGSTYADLIEIHGAEGSVAQPSIHLMGNFYAYTNIVNYVDDVEVIAGGAVLNRSYVDLLIAGAGQMDDAQTSGFPLRIIGKDGHSGFMAVPSGIDLRQGAAFTAYNGSPEGNVKAAAGSYCADIANGDGYIKTTAYTVNTGWKLVTRAA